MDGERGSVSFPAGTRLENAGGVGARRVMVGVTSHGGALRLATYADFHVAQDFAPWVWYLEAGICVSKMR